MPTWVFVVSKCWQNFKILQLAWTLAPNTFWMKCLRCLIFAQTIVLHPYFMKITTSISIWLQLNHNGRLKKKLNGPFLWMGLNCLKAGATSRRHFAQICLKKSANWIFCQIDFSKKLKFLSLVNLHHFL